MRPPRVKATVRAIRTPSLEGPVSWPFSIKITATKMKVHTTCVMKVYQFSLKPSESVAIS